MESPKLGLKYERIGLKAFYLRFAKEAEVKLVVSRERLSEKLRQARVDAGLSQQEVAAALGYGGPQFVSNWERGLCSPPLEALFQIARICRVDDDEFLEFVTEEVKRHLHEMQKSSRKSMRGKTKRKA